MSIRPAAPPSGTDRPHIFQKDGGAAAADFQEGVDAGLSADVRFDQALIQHAQEVQNSETYFAKHPAWSAMEQGAAVGLEQSLGEALTHTNSHDFEASARAILRPLLVNPKA